MNTNPIATLRGTLSALLALMPALAGQGGCAAMHEAWQRDHCHYDGAYATGMNDARKGHAMNPMQFVGECPVEIEAEVMDGYREGYAAGAQAAPIGVTPAGVSAGGGRGHGPVAPAAAGGQWPCQNTLDCHGHGFCKDRGDGVKLCMDKGARGDYCTSTIDCGSGLWCKEGPGGLEICM